MGKYTVPRLRLSAPSSMAGSRRNRRASALITMNVAGPTEATQGSFIIAMAMSHQCATPMWMTFRAAAGRSTLSAHEKSGNADEAEHERVRGGKPESVQEWRGHWCRG